MAMAKQAAEPLWGLLDAHTHILPGMDDGSASPEESLEMLRQSLQQGVETVALTPHFYPHRETPEKFLHRRARAAQQLVEAAGQETLPRALLGAEVAYFEGVSRAEAIPQLCIGDSRVLLLEMPFCQWTSRMLGEVRALKERAGVIPMLAHVERYLGYHNRQALEEMAGEGVLLQCNASFFLRGWDSILAMRMMRRRQISLLGSDCHNMTRRPPNLALAAEKIRAKCGEETLDYLREMQASLSEGGRR